MDVSFHFVCDACGYRCLLFLHIQGECDGYKCPHCQKFFEIVHQDIDNVKHDFVGTEALPNRTSTFLMGDGSVVHSHQQFIGYEAGKHVPSGRPF